MRVLGVDPGLTRCGIGVVEGGIGTPLRMIAVGVVRTPVHDDPAERLLTLQTELDDWLGKHQPEVIAVERVFAKANIKGIRTSPKSCESMKKWWRNGYMKRGERSDGKKLMFPRLGFRSAMP